MPVFRCPIHGMSPVAESCTHVATACLDGTPLSTYAVIDGYGIANYVCPDCYATVKEIAKAFRKKTAKDVLQYELVNSGVCLPHLEEWYQKTGMGLVSDAVDAAHKKPPEAP